jgi:hypothetical protein
VNSSRQRIAGNTRSQRRNEIWGGQLFHLVCFFPLNHPEIFECFPLNMSPPKAVSYDVLSCEAHLAQVSGSAIGCKVTRPLALFADNRVMTGMSPVAGPKTANVETVIYLDPFKI